MKKRLLIIVAVLTMAITPSMAQIFLSEDEYNDGRRAADPDAVGALIPEQDIIYDQYYTPIGGELVLLTGFGVSYLLGKRKESENQWEARR